MTGLWPISNSSQPLCWFWTEDIHASREFLAQQGVEVVLDVQDIGSVSFVTFRDPDGNLLMTCQRNEPSPS